jgi:hypothetical protein
MTRAYLTVAALALTLLAQGLFGGQPGTGEARASDAALQHALREAGCVSPEVKQIWQRGHITAFHADCSADRVLTVICKQQVCHIGDPEPEEDEP